MGTDRSMRNKKRGTMAAFVAAILLVSSLTACVKSNISKENDKYDLMAEYVAGILIERSYDNIDRYYAMKEVKGGDSDNPNGNEDPSLEDPNKEPEDIWSSFLGLSDCKTTYAGAFVGKEFDYGLLYTGARNENEKLVVFIFNITNTSNHDIIISNKGKKVDEIYYEIAIYGLSYRVFTSGFYNEFISLDKKVIAPGESVETFLMFSVPDEVQIEKFALVAPNGEKRELVYEEMEKK